MNSLDEVRVGNIVDYDGSLGSYNYVQVLEVNHLGDGRAIYSFRRHSVDEYPFSGYQKDIKKIYLEKEHLKSIGFQYDTAKKLFSLNGIEIIRFSDVESPEFGKLTFVDLGFKILPPDFPLEPTREQINELTTPILYLHTLQNYCSDVGVMGIDFSLIRS